jgi:hypothetical protein
VRIAIHQPNFVPWKPFFQKMAAVDVFVLLRHCQFSREVYQHRFKYQEHWYTMSVTGHRMNKIMSMLYAQPERDWASIKRKLPAFEKFFNALDSCICMNLARTNELIIESLRQQLGIPTEIRLDSPTELKGTERLVEICQEHGATTYLAGPSGGNYMDFNLFKNAGITVEFQDQSKLDKRHVFEAT